MGENARGDWSVIVITLYTIGLTFSITHGWFVRCQARFAHPAEEHLIPLMVVAGAAGADVGVKNYADVVMGCALAGFRFG